MLIAHGAWKKYFGKSWHKYKIGSSYYKGKKCHLLIAPGYSLKLEASGKAVLIKANENFLRRASKVLQNTEKEIELLLDPLINRKLIFKYHFLGTRNSRVEFLRRIIDEANKQYYNEGDSFLTDYEYDRFKELLEELDPSAPELSVIGPEPKANKVPLPCPAGSLSKCHSLEDVLKFTRGKTAVVTPKLDGVSVILHYKNGKLVGAYTRGDGFKGQDIFNKVVAFGTPPPRKVSSKVLKDFVVRGEAVLDYQSFQELQDEGFTYKNPRNTVAGLLNMKNPNPRFLKRVTLFCYSLLQPKTGLPLLKDKEKALELLKKLGFSVPKFKKLKITKTTDLQKLYETVKPPGVDCDGIVIDIPDRFELDPSGKNPKWAVAWKPPIVPQKTTVVKVEWNVTRHGRIQPRVKVKPVQFNGVEVTYATGKNAEFIKKQGIDKGAKVLIVRSGDVIPDIVKVIKSVKPSLPERCPECGSKLVWKSVNLYCTNPKCPAKLSGSLLHFIQSLGVKGAGPGTVSALKEAGVETVDALFDLREEDLEEILGPKRAKQFLRGLKKALDGVPLFKLAHALGFWGEGFGPRKLDELFSSMTKKQFSSSKDDRITKLREFLEEHQDVVKVIYPWDIISGPLSGMVFAFTGFRDKDAEDFILKHGGKIGGVTRSTSALFVKSLDLNTSKIKKAKELGIKIVPQKDMWEFLESCLKRK